MRVRKEQGLFPGHLGLRQQIKKSSFHSQPSIECLPCSNSVPGTRNVSDDYTRDPAQQALMSIGLTLRTAL